MPMYPELEGFPEICNASPFFAQQVRYPYRGVDEVTIQQGPIISDTLPGFRMFFELTADPEYDHDATLGIGYDTDAEHEIWGRLRGESSALANNTAFYEPSARDQIVAMAELGRSLIDEIDAEYGLYEGHAYPARTTAFQGGGLTSWGAAPNTAGMLSVPLSVPDGEALQYVDMGEGGLFSLPRNQSRNRIRDMYRKAIQMIWCARYGRNQSLVVRENRQLYNEAVGGADVGSRPPPPPPPGDFDVSPFPPPPGNGWQLDTVPSTTGPGGPQQADPAFPAEDPDPYDPDSPPPGLPEDFAPVEPAPKKKRRGGGAAAAVIALIVVGLAMKK